MDYDYPLPAETGRVLPPAFPPGCLDSLLTPALVAFRERIEHNIGVMKSMVGDFRILRPHIKTHKSAWVLRRLLQEGLVKGKAATLREVEMCLETGLHDVLLAHPPVGAKAAALAALARRFPEARLSTICDEPLVLEHLARAARQQDVTVGVRVDLDVGMQRTGIGDAQQVLGLARRADELDGSRFEGLHAYDGHVRGTPDERRQQFAAIMQTVGEIRRVVEGAGIACREVTLSGSATFQFSAHHAGVTECSPGTWIYWDLGATQNLGDLDFKPAVYVLGRVVSAARAGRITTDTGNKAVSTDSQGSPGVLVYPTTGRLAALSEEHGIFAVTAGGGAARVGDAVLVCPRHVCSTVHLFDEFALLDAEGRAEILPIEAGTRVLSAGFHKFVQG